MIAIPLCPACARAARTEGFFDAGSTLLTGFREAKFGSCPSSSIQEPDCPFPAAPTGRRGTGGKPSASPARPTSTGFRRAWRAIRASTWTRRRSASGVGEAVADFGQAVARLASPVDRMNRRNDEAFAAAGLAALHERQTRAGLAARKDTGGVAGFHDGRMAAFDRDLGEVLKRAPSAVARQILKRQGAALKDLMSRGAARFEARARIVERRVALDGELDNLATLARQDPDDHALHRALLDTLLGAASNEFSPEKMARSGRPRSGVWPRRRCVASSTAAMSRPPWPCWRP